MNHNPAPSTTREASWTRPLAWAVGAMALLWGAGCQPTYTDYSAFVSEPKPIVAPVAYRVAPPDRVAFQSKRVREIDGHTEMISPDGKVHLPLLGNFFVAGMTVEEISALITDSARRYYEDADVSVRVISYASQKIFVFGEVAAPGEYAYTGRNSVLQTLAKAYPTRLADPAKIHILRPSPDGEMRRRMTVDLNDIVKRGDTTLDAILQEGDIIYVPANPLAAVGLTLQQLLLPVQPAAAVIAGPGNIEEEFTGERSYGNAPSGGGN